MKKHLPFLITLSLLLGLMITVATTRISWININGGTCGYSLYATKNTLGKPLHACNYYEYGWPVRYVESSSNVFVLNHSGPAGATIYSYSSFSRLRIGADWALWSIVSGVVVFGGAHLHLTQAQPPRKTKKA